MEKKQYISPLMEVEKINLSSCILDGSPVKPVPPHPGGAPAHRAPTLGNDSVPVF